MLQLGDECVTFEKGSSLAETFYDNLNERICTVRGNGAMGISGKKVRAKDPVISLRIRDLGRIHIIKFSKNDKYLAVQRHENSVDIVVVDVHSPISSHEVTQTCKMKTAKIKGIEWITNNQFLLITTQGLELYQIDERKHSIKLLKTLNSMQEWSVYNPATSLLILAAGPAHSQLQPIVIKGGQFVRLTRFDVDFGVSNSNTHLQEQNVSVEILYGRLYLRTLRFSRRDSSVSDVALYEIPTDPNVAPRLRYVLGLGLPGMFGVHVIDSLVIVHLQQQRRSLVFDIAIRPEETNQWAVMEMEMYPAPALLTLTGGLPLSPLYSHQWVIFSPDIVIDPEAGLFSRVTLQPEKAVQRIKNTMTLLHFLLNRSTGKKAALNQLCEAVNRRALRQRELCAIFDLVNGRLAAATAPVDAVPVSREKALEARSPLSIPAHSWQLVTQEELQSHVLIPASEREDGESKRYLANAQLAYIRSLRKNAVDIDPYLNDSLVETLVAAGETSRLYQLVNYRTISDSKPLAFLLLSYETRYPPLFQYLTSASIVSNSSFFLSRPHAPADRKRRLFSTTEVIGMCLKRGVDMLMRSGTAADEMAEVLLAKGQLVEALRYLDTSALSDRPSTAVRILESAPKTDRPIWHALHNFMQTGRSSIPIRREVQEIIRSGRDGRGGEGNGTRRCLPRIFCDILYLYQDLYKMLLALFIFLPQIMKSTAERTLANGKLKHDMRTFLNVTFDWSSQDTAIPTCHEERLRRASITATEPNHLTSIDMRAQTTHSIPLESFFELAMPVVSVYIAKTELLSNLQTGHLIYPVVITMHNVTDRRRFFAAAVHSVYSWEDYLKRGDTTRSLYTIPFPDLCDGGQHFESIVPLIKSDANESISDTCDLTQCSSPGNRKETLTLAYPTEEGVQLRSMKLTIDDARYGSEYRMLNLILDGYHNGDFYVGKSKKSDIKKARCIFYPPYC
ncbi:hypothetical protein PRIPAC_74401 [Pristionchus pacificus]|uniref:Uncharacterized protein n=1 Tax=Pristionchus pacificus TaxID=54126 RepID=A0A2A6CRI8_PRIPA|nr:hypothetical protein PRIPAC_74401 [Pristionchus pacificus]|eukprot:PDM80815.1 hypothetical protein PRIPAC_35818 [Pristionchus pacificus]